MLIKINILPYIFLIKIYLYLWILSTSVCIVVLNFVFVFINRRVLLNPVRGGKIKKCNTVKL